MRALFGAAVVAFLGPFPLFAQSESLADIRQDIVAMQAEMQRLNQELFTTGLNPVVVTGDQIERMNAIETQLRRITAKTEELEFRIGRVVKDGSNRLGDLEFRVCELDPDCDIATLGQSPVLGGDAVPAAPEPAPVISEPGDGGALASGELAVSEEADFNEAQQALENGDYIAAAQLFALFRENYPLGPLEAAALVGEGRALDGQDDTREAARRYLLAYSSYPDDRIAPEALWRLGVSLGALGSVPEACVTLSEVSGRYAGSEFVEKAEASRLDLNCQ